jgi:phosphatidylglycerophosphate synthase
MQIVIAVPTVAEIGRLEAPVCGVPLLRRLIATALRGGATEVLLVLPSDWPRAWLARTLRWPAIESLFIDVGIGRHFDPASKEDWRAIADRLDDRFLWMPSDYLPHRAALLELLRTAARHPNAAVRFGDAPEPEAAASEFDKPVVLLKRPLMDGTPQAFETAGVDGRPGVSVRSGQNTRDVEIELVRRSGKITDGIFSKFNRMLCRPAVRRLSHTRVTPNAVSFVGLGIALLAGLCFAQGSWLWNVAGAALFFLSGMADEIDGMLARLKFQESPFGCWLETFADYSSYLLIFAGVAIGGYRRAGGIYLITGAALLFGCALSFVVISIQRKLAAPADRPNEYSRNYLVALERDSANPVSRFVRQMQFLTKKGVLIHYLVIFAVVGALPVFLFLTAIGANVAWMVTIYFNRRLFSPKRLRYSGLTSHAAVQGAK